jgi:cytoskeletal protein RodZ
MRQVQITVTYQFLERMIFILIILVLGFLLFQEYTAEDACTPAEDSDTVPSTQPSNDDGQEPVRNDTDDGGDPVPDTPTQPANDTTDEAGDAGGDSSDDTSDSADDTQDDGSDTSDEQLSGEVTATIEQINFDVQNDSRARVESIQVTIENGRDDDVLLFATVEIQEAGNQDLEVYNPIWDQVEMPLVQSGDTTTVQVEPSKSWPPGIEEDDRISIYGEFATLQGNVNATDSATQEI